MCVHDRTNGHFDRDHRHQAGQAVVRLREAQELREAQAREAAQGHEADLAATQIGGLNPHLTLLMWSLVDLLPQSSP